MMKFMINKECPAHTRGLTIRLNGGGALRLWWYGTKAATNVYTTRPSALGFAYLERLLVNLIEYPKQQEK